VVVAETEVYFPQKLTIYDDDSNQIKKKVCEKSGIRNPILWSCDTRENIR
jgi:hypothetical protein